MANGENWSGRNAEKDALRDAVWQKLVANGAAIGDPYQSIPDFVGSDRAAEVLSNQAEWKSAVYLMVSPDVPQIGVRKRAILAGKTIYMAVPQLREGKCFIEISLPILEKSGMTIDEVSRWQGAVKLGNYIDFNEMHPIDLSVTGCVAVSRAGGRTGKGGGFADLEHALMRRFKRMDAATHVITTVHPLQIVDSLKLPLQPHDTRISMIVTENEVVRIPFSEYQPLIDWSRIQTDQMEKIPVLKKLYQEEMLKGEKDASHR